MVLLVQIPRTSTVLFPLTALVLIKYICIIGTQYKLGCTISSSTWQDMSMFKDHSHGTTTTAIATSMDEVIFALCMVQQ